jgi:hypothetical protein
MENINFAELIGTTLALMIPLVPVVGFTLRFTLKPLIEAYARARAPMGEIPNLKARIELLEAHLAAMAPRVSQVSQTSAMGEPMPRVGTIERI